MKSVIADLNPRQREMLSTQEDSLLRAKSLDSADYQGSVVRQLYIDPWLVLRLVVQNNDSALPGSIWLNHYRNKEERLQMHFVLKRYKPNISRRSPTPKLEAQSYLFLYECYVQVSDQDCTAVADIETHMAIVYVEKIAPPPCQNCTSHRGFAVTSTSFEQLLQAIYGTQSVVQSYFCSNCELKRSFTLEYDR